MTLLDTLTRLLQTLVCCLRRARSASRSKPSPKAVPGRGRSAEAVDESETGSANFYGPSRDCLQPVPAVHFLSSVHLVTLQDLLPRCWKRKSAQIAHTA